MQLLIPDRTYSDFEGEPEEWFAELRSVLDSYEEPYSTEHADIGPGADLPMVLAIFSGLGTIFMLGEKIEKNIDAWMSIARRFVAFVTRLRQRFGSTRIDADGAGLLALTEIISTYGPIRSISKVAEVTVSITPFSGRDPTRLDCRYDALYIQTFEVDGEHTYVCGIKSSGGVEFIHRYGAHFFNF